MDEGHSAIAVWEQQLRGSNQNKVVSFATDFEMVSACWKITKVGDNNPPDIWPIHAISGFSQMLLNLQVRAGRSFKKHDGKVTFRPEVASLTNRERPEKRTVPKRPPRKRSPSPAPG